MYGREMIFPVSRKVSPSLSTGPIISSAEIYCELILPGTSNSPPFKTTTRSPAAFVFRTAEMVELFHLLGVWMSGLEDDDSKAVGTQPAEQVSNRKALVGDP